MLCKIFDGILSFFGNKNGQDRRVAVLPAFVIGLLPFAELPRDQYGNTGFSNCSIVLRSSGMALKGMVLTRLP